MGRASRSRSRYHELEVDDRAFTLGFAAPGASRKRAGWTAGLSWYLTRNLWYTLNFERTVFDDDAERAAPRRERPRVPHPAEFLETRDANEQDHRRICRPLRLPLRSRRAAVSPPARRRRQAAIELLNVSYDPTRELWRDINADVHPARTRRRRASSSTIKQSHGGSSTQARAVIDGLEADVVTLALWSDTDAIAKKGLINRGWEKRAAQQLAALHLDDRLRRPQGQPEGDQGLAGPGQARRRDHHAQPEDLGQRQLSFFSAWGSVVLRGGSREQAVDFVTKLYKQVPVLDSGARGATTTFVQKKIGDVHLAWENEAHLEVREAKGELELVYPPISIRAEPHVAVVDQNVDRKKTRAAAEAYLKFLYTEAAQEIIAKHFYRPSQRGRAAEHAATFPEIKLFAITDIGKDWDDVTSSSSPKAACSTAIYKPQGKMQQSRTGVRPRTVACSADSFDIEPCRTSTAACCPGFP